MNAPQAARVSPLRSRDPRELGRYRIVGRLGEGGMGTVYLGEDPEKDDQKVAVKVIRADLAAEPDFRRRFRSEVSRAQQVPPFCTAEVLDSDPDHEYPYLVVEFVDGPSLAEVVKEQGPLSAANLHGLAIGMATALAAIHAAGVIHRDLKPRNVLLPPGNPKVIDFGIARAVDATSHLTGTHEMLGTVEYMPPERLDTASRVQTTPAADIFAWGAVVAYAGLGRTPFQANSMPLTAMRILHEEPDLEGLTPAIRRVVARALAKDPADRPTARELLDLLLDNDPGDAGKEQPQQPPGDSAAPAKRRRTALLVGALAVVLAAAIAVPLALRNGGAANADLKQQGVVPTASTGAPAVTGPSAAVTGAAPTPSTAAARSIPAGAKILDEDFSGGGNFPDRTDSGGSCRRQDDALMLTRGEEGWFRCAGPGTSYGGDLEIAVTAVLATAGACASVWFLVTDSGGYQLSVCESEYRLERHQGGNAADLGSQPLANRVGLGEPVQVTLRLTGNEVTLLHGTAVVGSASLSGRPDSGRVTVGLSGSRPAGVPPYRAAFTRLSVVATD